MKSDELFRQHVGIVLELSRCLGEPFVPKPDRARELKVQVARCARLIRAGRLEEAAWHIRLLQAFVGEWDTVARVAPALIEEFRSRILSDDPTGGYLGVRTEVACAALICLDGTVPRRGHAERGEPDFCVPALCSDMHLEATSAHLTKLRSDNFGKIRAGIVQKASKPYCGPDAALFFDYTSILHAAGDAMATDFPDHVRAVVQETCWGAVLLTALVLDEPTQRLRRIYLRFDGARQYEPLRDWLDQHISPARRHAGMVAIPPTA